MKNILILLLFTFLTTKMFSQRTYEAQNIISMLDTKQEINISDATIVGDLNFTDIEKKYKGGRYGVKGGIAQEYFSRVSNNMTFTNCTFSGEIITQTEVWKGRERQENFTTFLAHITFKNCQFNENVTIESIRIMELLTIEDCTFEKSIKFKHANFDVVPVFQNNQINGRLVNEKTNWNQEIPAIEKPQPRADDMVKITLKNPTLKKINIKFGNEKWTLSPISTSELERRAGTKIYIEEKGKDRLLMVLDKSMDYTKVDVTK